MAEFRAGGKGVRRVSGPKPTPMPGRDFRFRFSKSFGLCFLLTLSLDVLLSCSVWASPSVCLLGGSPPSLCLSGFTFPHLTLHLPFCVSPLFHLLISNPPLFYLSGILFLSFAFPCCLMSPPKSHNWNIRTLNPRAEAMHP